MILEHLHQLEHGLGVLPLELDIVLRNHRDLGGADRDLGAFERRFHALEALGGRKDLVVVAVLAHVLRAGAEDHLEQPLLVRGALLDDEVSLAMEHPGDRAVLPQVPAVLREDVPELGHGAVAVVGQDAHEQRHAAGPVSLVIDLFVGHARQFSRPAHDRALDVVGGHVVRLGGRHGQPQSGIGIDVAAPVARRHRHLFDQPGEDAPALGVRRGLLVLDRMPL